LNCLSIFRKSFLAAQDAMLVLGKTGDSKAAQKQWQIKNGPNGRGRGKTLSPKCEVSTNLM